MSTYKPLTSVLIKPAGPDCNLNCSYCFYLAKAALFPDEKTHRMREEILKETVKQVMRQGESNVSFGWQGGEPTLMGRGFFQRAVQYQVRFGRQGQVVGNGLQTNGILIEEGWAAFLRDANFLVGLSIDGPQHVHDHYRHSKGQQPTWERVVRARDMLLNAGVQVNALTVVTAYSVQFAREIYDFHKKNDLIHMQFIPCIEPDPINPAAVAPYSVTAEAYGNFLCELFDLWLSVFRYGLPKTSTRWFDSLFCAYVDMQPPECTLTETCGDYVEVEHNGDVFSCDFFVDPSWRLGNVLENSLSEMLNSPRQREFGAIKANLPVECQTCQWQQHCRGGCPKERQVTGQASLSYLCQAYKAFFAFADGRMRKIADQWRRNQGITTSMDDASSSG